jgi:hypothetical protein
MEGLTSLDIKIHITQRDSDLLKLGADEAEPDARSAVTVRMAVERG